MRRKLGADNEYDDVSGQGPLRESLRSSVAGHVPFPMQSLVDTAVPSALEVGRADDPAEAAADRMAESALGRIRRLADPVQPGGAAAPSPRATSAAGAARVGLAGGRVDDAAASTIAASRGKPLAGAVKGRMESAFGRGFGSVRVHDGAAAAQASEALSARAFTRGSDIFFARGQFDPSSPAGEQVLAHELAHVVQGSGHSAGALHRWPWSEKDPAKQLEKEKAAKEKKERKAQEKQEKAETKARAKQSKKNYKTEKTRLKEERQVGTAARTGMREAILADQAGGGNTSATANDLNKRFDAALAQEKNLFDTLVESLGEDAARDRAYKTVWLDTSDAELRAVRPPRETAAERLTRDVRQARTGAGVREMMDQTAEHGQLLPKNVEMLYDTFVIEVDRLMGPPDDLSLADAEAQAERTIWDLKQNASAKKKRPTPGSPVDLQAKKDARIRNTLNPNPPPAPKKSALEKGQEGADAATKYGGYGAKGLGGVSKILEKAGKGETDRLQQGLVEKDEPTGGLEQRLPVVGGLIKASEDASSRVKSGQLKDKTPQILPKSVETQAGEGITASTNVLTDLLSGVQALFRFATSVNEAHNDTNPRSIMKATKASSDALSVVAKTGREAAELAKFIDPGVTSAVGSVIPGFNIFISVMSIVSNAMTMGQVASRVHDTNQSLFAARGKDVGGAARPDVMVYPLLRVLQTYTKSLEQAVWSTSVAIASFATSVATVASGGGYGIPAAVQAGVKVVDLLHSVGHFIADQVLVSITKKAQKDSLLALEGAAENQLEKDPTMAVDGIILAAVKKDATAEMFLKNYRLDGKPIDRTVLDKLSPDPANVGNERIFTKIRAAVMAEMGEDENPQFFYQKWLKTISGLAGTAKKHTADKWAATGSMATDRNALDGSAPGAGKRGAGWRLKMMFKGPKAFERSKRKTKVNVAASPTLAPAGPTVADNSTMGMDRMQFAQYLECECGSARLLVGANEQQRDLFAAALDKQSDNALLAASQDPNNSPEWQEFFRDVLSDRALAKAGAGV